MRFTIAEATAAVADLPLVVGADLLSLSLRGTWRLDDDGSDSRPAIDVQAVDVDDACRMAAVWGLAYAPGLRRERRDDGRLRSVHHVWTGRVPTPSGSVDVQVVAVALLDTPDAPVTYPFPANLTPAL